MFLGFFKEPAPIVFVFCEGFSGGFILFELEMVSFLPIVFKLFFRESGFAHYLRTFHRFFSICKVWE